MESLAIKPTRLAGRLSQCVVCSAPLPLRLPQEGETGSPWHCIQCETRYLAILDEESPASLRQNVRREGEMAPSAPTPNESSLDLLSAGRRYEPQGNSKIALPARNGVLCPLENSFTRQLDRDIGEGIELQVLTSGRPFMEVVQKPRDAIFSEQVVRRFVECFERSSAQVADFFQQVPAGHSANLAELEAVAQQGLMRAAEDPDLFVTLGISVPADAYPGRHSTHVAMVAMSIGASMGYDTLALLELAMGCLIHDLGMLRIDRINYHEGRVLGSADFREIAKHPMYTLELLKHHLDRLPYATRMVAYQMHERSNGSGYPRGRLAHQIHDLAKIAAVADVFVALTSERPHRPGMMPYYALERILRGVKDGLYDGAVVRALLKTVSLFPVGSFVELSDGRTGKVVRANGEHYARPVVLAWDDADAAGAQTAVDLSKEDGISVQSAISAPGSRT
jgi:HD-GYP domain-containing protein (c-di-GMP phosphodiesterase class II)